MRLFVLIALAATLLPAAETPATKTPARQPAATSRLAGIPAGAVESGPGTYRYTDAEGKTWIYRQSPFGVMRVEEKAAAEITPSDTFPGFHAKEDGDTIRFEQVTPFGTRKWQRKKSELDATEQAVWDRERARSSAEGRE